MKIPLQSRLNTSDEPITSVSEHPQFQYKNSIMWNGTIRNAYTTQGSGFVSTTGHEVNIEQTEKGVAFKYGDKTLRDNYNWVLANKYKTSPQATGKRTSSVIYNNKLYTLYDADEVVSLIISNRDGSNPEQIDLDCSSAVLSSVYKVNKAPILWLVKTTEVGNNLFDNAVRGYSLEDLDTPLLSYDTDDYIPLGDCNSATVFMQSNGKVSYVLGCDDIDHNRSKVFVFNKNTTEPTIYKWFGCVGPSGIITGEPIPDPDMFKNIDRNSNGTYSWDMYGTTTNYIKGQLILCGRYLSLMSKYLDGVDIEDKDNVEILNKIELAVSLMKPFIEKEEIVELMKKDNDRNKIVSALVGLLNVQVQLTEKINKLSL